MDIDTEPESSDPQAKLERALIEDFLSERGHDLKSINAIPRGERESLLRGATAFAALKLAEIDARAHFVHEIG